MFRFNKFYFSIAVLLFFIEVLIALYAHDQFIRPYFGDYLVVILIYSALKSFFNFPYLKTAIGVFIFACLIELSQYFELYKILRLEHDELSRTVIGTYFSWTDILAYGLGVLSIILVERRINSTNSRYLPKH